MFEYVGNVHIHTQYSDGNASHDQIASAAREAGLDFVITTDHNVYVPNLDGWRGRTLLLVGEEIHDVHRQPQANHLLVLDAQVELAQAAADPQALIDAVAAVGGVSFIAHPFEHSGALANEPEINWESWGVKGFTGMSIWNYMSEFKSYIHSIPQALFAAFMPHLFIRSPFPETLHKWDELLQQRHMPALGTSDAHATTYHLGPLHRVLFPYSYLFRTINMHLLLREQFTGDIERDGALIYRALAQGQSFVAYDLLGSARGFRFVLRTQDGEHTIGDELAYEEGMEIVVTAPERAYLRLMCGGQTVAAATERELHHRVSRPGAYRVEAYRRRWLRPRGWIFSNPIYVQ